MWFFFSFFLLFISTLTKLSSKSSSSLFVPLYRKLVHWFSQEYYHLCHLLTSAWEFPPSFHFNNMYIDNISSFYNSVLTSILKNTSQVISWALHDIAAVTDNLYILKNLFSWLLYCLEYNIVWLFMSIPVSLEQYFTCDLVYLHSEMYMVLWYLLAKAKKKVYDSVCLFVFVDSHYRQIDVFIF